MHILNAIGVAACLAATVACSSSQTSAQLKDARQEYQRATEDQNSKLALDSLDDAKNALQQAEKAHQRSAGSYEEKSLAYVASRKAQIAMAKADTAKAELNQKQAQDDYVEQQQQMLKQTRSDYQHAQASYSDARERLRDTSQQLQQETEARKSAQERARLAEESLKDVAMVKEEDRGTVITLDGAVLFGSGKSELLPLAKEKLQKVATTIQDMGQTPKLVVEGYTDSRGTQAMNQKLSQDRAEAVADQLVNEGIQRQNITTKGLGESNPIASNDTPEGRANNRRVEIVVNDASTGQQ